jgi:rieske iron-sulfur protein
LVAVHDDKSRPGSASTETGPPAGRVSRRRVLGTTVGVGLGIAGISSLAAAVRLVPRIVVAPAQEPPAKGDVLVGAQGPRKGQVLTAEDVPVDATQVFAWPMDPTSKVVKNGNTNNLILLVRGGDAGWYSQEERLYTTQNVAAYSAVCTHLCCTVSDWRKAPSAGDAHGALVCPCHSTHFNPWAGARVIDGPAPRPLPILPLAADTQGRLIVAGPFLTQVGCAT